MNSCILMAEIIQDPQLRYTSDNLAIAEMMVEFPNLRVEDKPETLKVVGWGNLALEIQSRFKTGDRVVIEGRLSINTVERREGFKEKRAELVAQRIHSLGADTELVARTTSSSTPGSTPAPSNVVPLESRRSGGTGSSGASGGGHPQSASPRSTTQVTQFTNQTQTRSTREPVNPAPEQPDRAVEKEDIPF